MMVDLRTELVKTLGSGD
jgi:hypothetical protein